MQGVATRGIARQAWHGSARPDEAVNGAAGTVRCGWLFVEGLGTAGMARVGFSRHGTHWQAGSGLDWHGTALQAAHGLGVAAWIGNDPLATKGLVLIAKATFTKATLARQREATRGKASRGMARQARCDGATHGIAPIRRHGIASAAPSGSAGSAWFGRNGTAPHGWHGTPRIVRVCMEVLALIGTDRRRSVSCGWHGLEGTPWEAWIGYAGEVTLDNASQGTPRLVRLRRPPPG